MDPRNILIEIIQQPEILKFTEKISEIEKEILEKYGDKNGIVS